MSKDDDLALRIGRCFLRLVRELEPDGIFTFTYIQDEVSTDESVAQTFEALESKIDEVLKEQHRTVH